LSEDVYDELAARFDQALAAFRASRINDYSGGEFPAKPFLGGSGRRFDRYGYFLAERLLAGLSPAEVCDLLLDETALAERVIEFLGTTDRDYAALLSPGIDPVEIIEAAPYEQLAEARHGSWNGRFRWLDSFAQIARTTPFDYSNVLDVGCGTGHNLRQLVAAGGSGLGIDPSAAMLANWVDHKRLQSRCCGLFDLDDNGAFTLIMSAFDTFNHILVERSLAETLERLHSLLAPGGHLVFDFVTEVGLASKVGIGRFDERDSGWQVLDVHSYDRSEALMDTLSFIRNLGTDTMYLERHRERATTLGKAMRALHSAGFTEVRPFASNGIDDPTPDEARIFMHARRPDQSAPRKARQNMILRTRVPSNFQADMA
jgi:SAM-dependent methyltransferase